MVKIMRPAAATPPKKVKQSLQTTKMRPTAATPPVDDFGAVPAQAPAPKPHFHNFCQIVGSLRAATKERRLLEKEVAELEAQIAFKREQLRWVRDAVMDTSQALFPDLCDMSDDVIKAAHERWYSSYSVPNALTIPMCDRIMRRSVPAAEQQAHSARL